MDRIAEDLFCCTCLQQMPQMEHANTVGNIFDHRKIMGNKQICRSGFLLNILHQVHHLCLNGHIQCGNTLVCDDEFRIHDQGPGNAHTLSLSTGKLMRIIFHSLFRIFDPHFLQKLDGFIPGFFLRCLKMPDHAFHDLLADGHRRVKTGHRILKNHGDPLSVNVPADPLFILFQYVHCLR